MKNSNKFSETCDLFGTLKGRLLIAMRTSRLCKVTLVKNLIREALEVHAEFGCSANWKIMHDLSECGRCDHVEKESCLLEKLIRASAFPTSNRQIAN